MAWPTKLAVLTAVGGAGAAGYLGLVTGALPLDVGMGRRSRPLGPQTIDIQAPREVVFEVIAQPYLGRTTRAMREKVRVLEQGSDMDLLPATERTTAGYRLYTEHDVELLTFIRRARTLGLHLDDIRDGGTPPCAAVRDLLDTRIAEIDATVTELLALRKALAETRRRAATCTGDAPVTICAISEDTAQPTAQLPQRR